jgi:hypothetical protein
MKRFFSLLVFASLMLVASPARAGFINGGFESGSFSGWQLGNVYMGVSEYSPLYGPLPAGYQEIGSTNPLDGHYVASIGTGNAYFLPGQGPFDVHVSQTVSMTRGEMLSGWSSFYNGDFLTQDGAYVRVVDNLGAEVATLWLVQSGDPAFGGAMPYRTLTPWTEWSWAAPVDGTYTLSLGVTSSGDNAFSSYGYHDAIRTPEPTTLIMLLAGVGAVSVARRRKTAEPKS